MKTAAAILGALAVFGPVSQAWAQGAPESRRLSIGALQEFGSLSKAYFGNTEAESEWVDHFGAFVTQNAEVNERLDFRIGLGGIFQFQKPENPSAKWGGSQFREFYIGPTVADLNYRMGADPRKPWGTLQFGMFPYKYTRSSNLGEYLFRSGPYPTFIWTGGYAIVNSAGATVQGLRLGWTGVENLSVDVLLSTETAIPPLYDFSLTGLAKYSLAGGLLEIGAGAQLKRVIPIHADSTRKENPSNSYFQVNGRHYTGNADYYYHQAEFWKARRDATQSPSDSLLYARHKADLDSVMAWLNPASPQYRPNLDLNYYTAAGVVLVGTATLDGKKLLPSGPWGPRDLELYAEIALLGFKNYPVFYESRAERMPVMVGFNVPTFRLLDLLSVEAEWFNSPWINSYSRLGAGGGGATPQLPASSETVYSRDAYNDVSEQDNISWSVLAQKKVAGVLTLSGQVARDHARFVSRTNWFGPMTDPNEALVTSKDWYWMLQFSFGI